MNISRAVARIARRALAKLPKAVVRRGARALPHKLSPQDTRMMFCGCFVDQAMDTPRPYLVSPTRWRHFATKYRLTFDGYFLAGYDVETSELAALSSAYEDDPTWLQRAVARRLAA